MIRERKCYSVKETAAILGVSKITIYRKIESKEIPSKRIGSRILIPAEFINNFEKVEK